MFRFYSICFVGLLSFALLGCSPKYQTFFAYEAPESQRGRECAVTCQSMRQKCEHWSRDSYQRCVERVQLVNMVGSTLSTLSAPGTPVPYNNSSSSQCSIEQATRHTECLADYNACYELCGGVVQSWEQCVSNCDKTPVNK